MIINSYRSAYAILLTENLELSKLLLLTDINFDPMHTTMQEVTRLSEIEFSGNGWPLGGVSINAYVTIDNDKTVLASNGVQVLAESGMIGPALACVLYVNNKPYVFVDFEQENFTLSGHYFSVVWPDNIILSIEHTN